MEVEKIFIGGWFQRTMLHLSEIYDFLKEVDSPLKLNKKKLSKYRNLLDISEISMNVDELDYIDIKTKEGVELKIYEDGLIILGVEKKEIEPSIKDLTKYYENKISPALTYLFSLGAPNPKELANIKTIYPYFVVLNKSNKNEILKLLKDFKQDKYFEIKKQEFDIYRGNKFYIINNKSEKLVNVEKFIEEQVFVREFKSQMHRYLNLHRVLWEKIDDIKEKNKVSGYEIKELKGKIDSYDKTINLIEARINQMDAYLETREAIVKNKKEFAKFFDVIEYKYQKLFGTLNYVKVIWQMTKNHINLTSLIFDDLKAKSTVNSVKDLTVITSLGVAFTFMRIMTGKPPELSMRGLYYLIILLTVGYFVNMLMKIINKHRKYEIKDVAINKDIK